MIEIESRALELADSFVETIEPLVDVQTFNPERHVFLTPYFTHYELWLMLPGIKLSEGMRPIYPRVKLHAVPIQVPGIEQQFGYFNIFDDDHLFSADLVADEMRRSADYIGRPVTTRVIKPGAFIQTLHAGKVEYVDATVEAMIAPAPRDGTGKNIWGLKDFSLLIAEHEKAIEDRKKFIE